MQQLSLELNMMVNRNRRNFFIPLCHEHFRFSWPLFCCQKVEVQKSMSQESRVQILSHKLSSSSSELNCSPTLESCYSSFWGLKQGPVGSKRVFIPLHWLLIMSNCEQNPSFLQQFCTCFHVLLLYVSVSGAEQVSLIYCVF